MALVLLRVAPVAALTAGVADALAPVAVHLAHDRGGIDAALAELETGQRLVIDVEDAGTLNLVLSRLLRKGLLGELDTALLLPEPAGYLAALGLPANLAGQLAVARSARSRLVGVLRDDSGGLCADAAMLTPWASDNPWWVRAVVDDQPLCDGAVRSLGVRRIGPSELEARVGLGRFRHRSARGRSLQLACDPAQIVADGVGRERPRGKRTFWSEPALWRLALPAD